MTKVEKTLKKIKAMKLKHEKELTRITMELSLKDKKVMEEATDE